MKWHMFISHAVFLSSLFVTALIILLFKVLRAVRQRRSPLHGKQIGHVPGQQLLDRIDHADREATFGYDVMIMALPMLFLVWASMRIEWQAVTFGAAEAAFFAGWLLIFAYGFWQYRRHALRKEKARDGLLAERVTGMQLNRLVANGCLVLHDLPCGDFNIDHVVIAPRGVYAIETKSFRKPKSGSAADPHKVQFDGATLKFSDFTTKAPIEQARRQAKFLASLIRESLGDSIPVTPAVSLPGWFIEKTADAKSADVFVFTPMGRAYEWFSYGEEVLQPGVRTLIAKALALRYPTVD
ncbi:nuclease-related domain-containing protein [Luteimonas granuli]|uniref:NERD domain-containing protein n=1 Tax=Luteimonas granuli TaxID=1176533 RepID=A0A518N6J4_9GAMM|nr:nuclease-related domain-containing protein [Luteimonas granuli]QDW67541.1 NERD domain-containing protein [Luteimonas granuli]